MADGAVVADHLATNIYEGYIGELVIMPTNSDFLGSLQTDAPGLVEADSDGVYSGVRGIIGYCIDSETVFRTSFSRADTNSYSPLNYTDANNRYNGINNGSGNGVAFYRNGGLLRAAYLMDKFYESAHAGGNNRAAALQTAIWEVLYDGNLSVSTGNGNYYVRNNTGNTGIDDRSNSIINITNGWFAEANADNWGGANYDPTDRVIFWLDPTDTDNNQAIITLNPFAGVVPIPEPGMPSLVTLGAGILMFLRKR